MNLSDPSDEDSSSEECARSPPAKRHRTDTLGASSTTSQGSIASQAAHESEDESPRRPNLEENNVRLSSDNCSSPNDRSDEFRPGFEDNDTDHEKYFMQPSFQQDSTDTAFYKNKKDVNEESESYEVDYSAKSLRMMSNMGYKRGKGLGKFEHGRVDPVEASTQRGRRGLGSKPSVVGEIPRDFKWSPDDEVEAEARETVIWIPSSQDGPIAGDLLDEWLRRGPKKLVINDETLFVEPQILKGVLDSKTIFDSLDDEDLRYARFRSNPYETIGSVIFLNRAAVKMANIDAIFDFMFTNAGKSGNIAADRKENILYFADVCAGPGGFSEYILYRKGWRAKGFGFTLKGQCDFKLSDFYAGPSETFDTYYGIKNDGDIYKPENLTSLKEYVLGQTNDQGVHFLMADGGFSVEGQENIQEILSKQLYLCQCLAALMLVRTGGHFVVKLFDVFTLFSVGLIYIMYKCFDQVCIHKPVTSRPANSERYLICKSKRLETEASERHLFNVNTILSQNNEDDVNELVPLSVIQEDTQFFDYIFNSNCILGERQIRSLLKISAFSKDKKLKLTNQATIREQCLKLWHLPDEVRKQPERLSPENTLQAILSSLNTKTQCTAHGFIQSTLNKHPRYIETPPDLETFKNIYDWHFMFLSSGRNSPDLKIFIGCGGKHVHKLEGSEWKRAADLQLTLPAKTLIYAEVIKEYRGEGSNQIYSKALHIIDAMMLGGIDISHLSLSERINQCDLFCTALNKPITSALPIKCKRIFNLEKFPTVIENLECRAMKRAKQAVTFGTPKRDHKNDMFYVVGSLLFLKEIKEPWIAQISKKTNFKYYYNTQNRRSEYHITPDACLDMMSSFVMRTVWPWEDAATAILTNQVNKAISREAMEKFIENRTAPR